MEVVISICAAVVGETIPCCCCCIFSGSKNTVKFQKNLDELEKEMKTHMDLRIDLQRCSTVSSAEEDRKAATVEEWLREAQELERKVLLTQEGIADKKKKKKKKKQLCTKRWRDSRKVSILLREVQTLLKKGRSLPEAQAIKHQR